MELKEDSLSDSSEEARPTAARRPISILISSFNNKASIHTSIQSFEDDGEVKFRANIQISQQTASNDDIVDICLKTKKKNSADIKLIAINSLLNGIGEQPISLIREESKEDPHQNNLVNRLETSEEHNELTERRKHQNLTKSKIKSIKNMRLKESIV